jgi:RNA-directed DNA polymerase
MERGRQQGRGNQLDLFDEALKASLRLDESGGGGTAPGADEERQASTASLRDRALTRHLMEDIASSANLDRAWKRVKANKGSAGVDRQTIQAFLPWFAGNRDMVVTDLLTGRFRPSPVRGVQIPKPGGGVRQLGIPTVLDRLVQQAILQVLEPRIDPTMSASSFGFRPGKNAHQAISQGQRHVAEGYGIVVDIDLEKFFDRVNHDILMARLARRIGDKRLLRIIRRFLQAGMLQDGVSIRRHEGTPQGGPLSPLLANILLDDLDKELEKRGHRFCRYADDCNIYVRSQQAGERVMVSVTRFLETRLRLRVNREKSAVAPVEERSFLGYQLTNDGRPRLSRRSFAKARDRLREITARQRAVPLGQMAREVTAFLTGWMLYFRHAEAGRDMVSLGKWVRRKLRCAKLRQCKHSLGIRNFLTSQGVPVGKATQLAASGKGWWRLAASPPVNEAMPNKWLAKLGLIDPVSRWEALQHDGNRRGTWSVRPVV